MAFAHSLLVVPVETSPSFLHSRNPFSSQSYPSPSPFGSPFHLSFPCCSSSSSSSSSSFPWVKPLSPLPRRGSSRIGPQAKATPQESEVNLAAEAFSNFKHLLLPITDQNPYLSEGTRQAVATTAALAKKYGADITVVVIDERQKESLPEHENQLSSVRWHLSEGCIQGGLCALMSFLFTL
ncbi:uncharacterized protein LOC116212528 isoform X2 [Punica granatum]|uniref:Uncharacterized protein LOC116212528 isoform X2 n=1 Tax=Punica granatum TaxID=22663 RepID=A0A6P8ECM8_PUNGR|nr:uncharacterized protein LOC116212528 isoform X2 [Punica granatum]